MPLADDLAFYYDLAEASGNAIESVAGVDGVETSGTIGASTGPGGVGGSRDFEAGDTEYFLAPDHANNSVADIDFTIVAWVNREVAAGTYSLVYKGDGDDLAYDLGGNASRFRFRISSANGFANLTTVTSNTFGDISPATWYFVAARHSASANTIDISVDGGAVDSAGYTHGSYNDGGSLYLGNNPFAEPHDGLLALTGLFKRYLSDAELDTLAASPGMTYDDITGGGATAVPVFMHHYAQMAGAF